MKKLLAGICAVLLTGCGGGGSSSFVNPPPVHAAGFSNASLSGGYAFGFSGIERGDFETGVGIITADGAGNFTSGEIFTNVVGLVNCHGSLSGTYSVAASGIVTAVLNVSNDGVSVSSGCVSSESGQFRLALANGGNSFVVVNINSVSGFFGSGARQ